MIYSFKKFFDRTVLHSATIAIFIIVNVLNVYKQADYFLSGSGQKANIILLCFILTLSLLLYPFLPKVKFNFLNLVIALSIPFSWFLFFILKTNLLYFDTYFILYQLGIMFLVMLLAKQTNIDYKTLVISSLCVIPLVVVLAKASVVLLVILVLRQKKYRFLKLFIILSASVIFYSFSSHFRFYDEQNRYQELIIEKIDTQKNEFILTEWKNDYWLYSQDKLVINSLDKELFYEIMTFPAFHMVKNPKKVLIIGGENLELVNEIKKLKNTNLEIYFLPDDFELYEKLKANEASSKLFSKVDMKNVKVLKRPIKSFLAESRHFYDLIFIDLLDFKKQFTTSFSSEVFYQMCSERLSQKGLLIGHAGSPMFEYKKYNRVLSNLKNSNLETLTLHKQLSSLGDWSWFIAKKDFSQTKSRDSLKFLFSEINMNVNTSKHLSLSSLNSLLVKPKPLNIID